jgi:transcriptional regulator with XRE-family HTH domain
MVTLVLQPWDLTTTPVRVGALLKALNRTQAQLGDVLGLTPVSINRWCNGRSVPDKRSRIMLEKLEATYVKDGT